VGIRCYWIFLMLVCTIVPVSSQERCPAPSFTLPANAPNVLSEQQENDFGDIIAEQIQSSFLVIDDEISTNISRIGQRLLDQLPDSSFRFQFYLVNFPRVNAFTLPGGRIYVARKLVAACRNEDELAGVLAHEIGHNITKHGAIDITRLFHEVLGIDSFGDRKDIFEKFNRLLDNVARNPGALKGIDKNESDEQITADRVSLYLAKRAGYSPDAFIQFWNRVADVREKTGSVLGDLFGRTRPEQKRLREMQRLVEQLPAACAGTRLQSTIEEFQQWKAAVMAYSGLGHRESLPAVEKKLALNPRLRGNITNMRFSPDGRYLLAQDSSSIFVLSREPFKILFRIDAQDALPAQFAPDSESIVFNTQDLRIEKWSVSEESRTNLYEVAVNKECINAKLSPDVKHIACLDTEQKLTMFNVDDGNIVFQKSFSNLTPVVVKRLIFALQGYRSDHLEFSPDGRYFIGVDIVGGQHFAYDFADSKFIRLHRNILFRLFMDFGFLSGNRFVGKSGSKGEQSAVVSFPSGEILSKMQIGVSKMTPVTNGDYLILSPIEKYPAGIMDLSQNKIFMALTQEAVDIYDKFYALEREDGVLYLFRIGEREALAKAELPQSPLPQLKAASLSTDMNWLAISESSRGAIWDLRKGERVFLSRNFQGAQFTADNTLLMDLPKKGEDKRVIVRLDPIDTKVVSSNKIENERTISYGGLYLVEERTNPNPPHEETRTLLAVSSAITGQDLWTRDYSKGFPAIHFNSEEDKAVFVWTASSDYVKEESKKDPVLKKRIESKKEQQGDYYLQVLQASTGKLLHGVYVETGRGSFRIRRAEVAGDYLTLYDNRNRLLIYSVVSGERLGQIFGVNGSVSSVTPLLAAENKPGVLTIYSLPSMEERGKLVFSHPLVYVKFSKDGKLLFALTNDQSTYLFNTYAMQVHK
jgi:WD40 repeat protein